MWGTGVTPVARMLLAASGWLAVLAVDLLPAAAPLRLAAVGAFVLLGPGTALLLPLRPVLTGRHSPAAPPDRSERMATVAESWLIAVMLSASALVLVAVGLMLANAFSASTTLFILSVTTSAAAVFPALGGAPRSDPEDTGDGDTGPGD